jgi:hypothetical protein
MKKIKYSQQHSSITIPTSFIKLFLNVPQYKNDVKSKGKSIKQDSGKWGKQTHGPGVSLSDSLG